MLVFTKTDRVSAATLQTNIAAFKEQISKWFAQLPAVFTCSAKTGDGRTELLGVVDEALTAIKAEARKAAVASGGPPVVTKKAAKSDIRKNRPDRARPW